MNLNRIRMRLDDILVDSEDVYIFELSSEDRKLLARTQWQICDEMDLHPVPQNHWAQMFETHPGKYEYPGLTGLAMKPDKKTACFRGQAKII